MDHKTRDETHLLAVGSNSAPTCSIVLRGVESRAQPADLAAVDRDDVETTWRRRSEAAQVVCGREDEPALLGRADARRRAAVRRIATRPNLDEHECSVGVAQNQVHFAAS